MTTRKHFYLVTEHHDEERVGLIEVSDTRKQTTARKNEEGVNRILNTETDDTYTYKHVGVGYYDFESEEDYEDRFSEVIKEKLAEIDAEHLEKAGLEIEVPA